MSILKGNLDSGNKFTANDAIRGLELIAVSTQPSFHVLETGDNVKWYMWINDSDEWIMHTAAPTASNRNSVGNIITGAGNSGANKTLSNLGTVAMATDLLPDADSTRDLGSSAPLYWAEAYIDKVFLHATNCSLTGGANKLTLLGGLDIGADAAATNKDFKYFFHTTNKFIVFDEDADDIIIADSTGLVLGGSEGAQDGLKMEFDGTADIAFSALATNDTLTFGPGAAGANLDVVFKGATSTSDAGWDASGDTFQICDDAIFNIGGTGVGTMDGIKMFYNAGDTYLDIDAVNAGDGIKFGSNTETDLQIHGTAYDLVWDWSENELLVNDSAKIVFGGASNDLIMTSDGTDVHFSFGATTNKLTIDAYAAQTAAMLAIDGGTVADWDGADNIGMLHLSHDTAMIHAGATMCYIGSTATAITGAEGFMMRVEDGGSNTSGVYAIEWYSAANHLAHVHTGSKTVTALTLEGAASATASVLFVDGDTNNWVGGTNTGMFHIDNDDMLASSTASLVYIDNAGAAYNSAAGTCLRIVDSGTAATAGTGYVAYISSTSNEALYVDAGAVKIDESITIGTTLGVTGASTFTAAGTFTAGQQSASVAVTATVDGTGTGTVADGTTFATVGASDANAIVILPTPTPGNVVWLYETGTGYELRTDTPASVAINGGTGDSAESAIAADMLVRAVCLSATVWVASQFGASGDESNVELPAA